MHLTATTLCLAALATLAPSAVQESTAVTPAFPQPREPLLIRTGGEGMNHVDLARSLSQVTGLNIVLSAEATQELQSRPVQLLADVEVPPGQVYPVVESILIEAGFYLSEISNGAPHVYMLRSTRPMSGVSPTNNARLVDAEQIDEYRDHPAVLVRTIVHMSIDTRQLTNSLRSLMTDAHMQAAIPVGNTNSLILVGLGRDVAELVQFLHETDAAYLRAMEEARVVEEARAAESMQRQQAAGAEEE